MRFFLKRLSSGAVGVRRRTSSTGSRRASFEQLGPRQLLAADVESSTDDVAYVAPGPADPGAALVAPLPGEPAAAGVVASPLWGDGGGATTQNGENGYGQFYPPAIADFTGSNNYGVWTFTGEVLDDKDVAGLVVRFGGLLEGRSAVVQANGTFQFTYAFPPGTTGVVTAIVTDSDGLDSDPVSYTIWG